MATGHEFPYTNLHDLNIDWILKIVKDFENDYKGINDALDAAIAEITAKGTTEISALVAAKNAILAAIQSQGEATIESIPEDYTALSNAVSALKNALLANVFNVLAWENGSISDTTGNNVESSERIRTKEYLPKTIEKLTTANAQGTFAIYAYNLSGAFIGAWNRTYFDDEGNGTFEHEMNIAQIMNNPFYKDYNLKAVYRISGGSVQVDTVSGVVITSLLSSLPTMINNMHEANDFAEYVKAENYGSVENINNSILWETGGINYLNGENEGNDERKRIKEFLPTVSNYIDFHNMSNYRGFFLYAYDCNTGEYVGGYNKETDTFVNDASETGYNTENGPFDIGYFIRRFPEYRFRIQVYVRNSGAAITDAEVYGVWTIKTSLKKENKKIRVIQYNIGKFNMGNTGGLASDVNEKIANYKEFLANMNADAITLQELTQYIDNANSNSSIPTLFNPIFNSVSHYEKETAVIGQFEQIRSFFTYLHTTGDYPAWAIVTENIINGRTVAIVSAVLNVSAPSGVNHQAQSLRALEKLTDTILAGYNDVIIGMDTNCLSEAETVAVKSFMTGKYYTSGNWGYLGYKETYNLSSNDYKCIDNIFVKGNMKIVNFSVPDVYRALSSDHYPVIADIVIY